MRSKMTTLLLLCLLLSLSGCNYNNQTVNNKNVIEETPSEFAETLTLEEVEDVLTTSGIQLSSCSNDSLPVFNDVEPAAFNIAGSDDILLIYVFNSIAERLEAMGDFTHEKQQDLFGQFSLIHKAKNTAIIHIINAAPDKYDDFIEASQRIGPIQKTVWEKLNELEKLTFTGAGEFWEARYVVEYYSHRYKTLNNSANYDHWSETRFSLRPKFEVPNDLEISYTYGTTSSSGSGKTTIRGNEFHKLGGSGGNGSIPLETFVYTVTVEWEGQKEVFEMTNIAEN